MANGRRTRGASCSGAQSPPSTSSWPSTRKVGSALGQYLCSREFVQQPISDSATSNFRRSNHRQHDYHPVPYFLVRPLMSGPSGPPPMMYPPCPPWVGWYGPWAPPLMHFHLGWPGPVEGFGHRGYYAGDDRYIHAGHQQDMRALR
jgi:hypothetical protein